MKMSWTVYEKVISWIFPLGLCHKLRFSLIFKIYPSRGLRAPDLMLAGGEKEPSGRGAWLCPQTATSPCNITNMMLRKVMSSHW